MPRLINLELLQLLEDKLGKERTQDCGKKGGSSNFPKA